MSAVKKIVDALNLSCSIPIIKAKKPIKEVEVGKCLEALTTNPCSKNDFPSWCKVLEMN